MRKNLISKYYIKLAIKLVSLSSINLNLFTLMFNKKERTLLFANNLWYLSEGMLGPLFGIFCAKFQSSPLDISWVWALYLISVGIVVICLGYISDFIYKEKLLILGYALQAVFTFCYIFVSTKQQLALLQIGLGISGGLSTTTWYALYARCEDKTHEGLTWGLANGLASIYTGVALLCGGLIIAYGSFEILFTVMGIIQLIATIYVSKLIYLEKPKAVRQFKLSRIFKKQAPNQ